MASLQRIQASMVDGRSRTPRYMQQQLKNLHDALIKSAPVFQQSITKDTGCSSTEAWLEIHATAQAIKHQYGLINFHQFLEQEYSISYGKDNIGNRIPIGCTYIVPPQHTRLYSIIQTSAAAIAAGNCVVIELLQTLSEIDRTLRETFIPVMDKDTFVIIDKIPQAETKFFNEQVIIVGAEHGERGNGLAKALNVPSSRVLAIVDRSADIQQAARHIVRARLRFSGRSPYAPDLVLVNEFAVKQFCRAAAQVFTEVLSDTVDTNAPTRVQDKDRDRGSKQSDQLTTLVSSDRGSIKLAKNRDAIRLSGKVNEPTLIIYPISSLDDAIDLANSEEKTLLAAFIFSDPKAAKYLSQFIDANVSFTNCIPTQLLIGAAAPAGHAISIQARYTQEMFSSPSPEYIVPTVDDARLSKILDEPASSAGVESLKAEIKKSLPDMQQPEGRSLGFFEQGLFTGLAIEATILVGIVTVCARYAVLAMLRKR